MSTGVKMVELAGFMEQLSLSKWGIADVTGLHELSGEYPQALSLALSYSFDLNAYDENAYHDLLRHKDEELKKLSGAIQANLISMGIKRFAIPDGQDPNTLKAVFPRKLAAARAGLWWIGKNSLLITREYGPRVHLATILMDGDFPSGQPMASSGRGACNECAKVCPYGYINDREWHVGLDRSELFDYFQCSMTRAEAIEEIGHKDECGFCLLVCPVGKRQHDGV